MKVDTDVKRAERHAEGDEGDGEPREELADGCGSVEGEQRMRVVSKRKTSTGGVTTRTGLAHSPR